MKNYLIFFFIIIQCIESFSQVYENKYVSLNADAVIREHEGVGSRIVSRVPKGKPIQILEKVHGPVYIAKYKNKKGYLVQFNLPFMFEKDIANSTPKTPVFNPPEKIFVTVSHKNYIINGNRNQNVVTVPAGETVQVLEKVMDGKYIVRFKNNVGFCDLGRISVKNEKTKTAFNSLKINKTVDKDRFNTELPPILSIENVTFSKNNLRAGETAQLVITLKNSGPGDARNVYVRLSGYQSGLEYANNSSVPTIKSNGGIKTVSINIKGNLDLSTGEALINIDVVEPNFKVKIPEKQLKFSTLEYLKPELILAQYILLEDKSSEPNQQIDVNEIVNLKFIIQNIGKGDAENVEVEVANNQEGVMLLGVVNDNEISRHNPKFKRIESGEYETVIYQYFVNSELKDEKLKFNIRSKERLNKFGFSSSKSFVINKQLRPGGYIETINRKNNIEKNKTIIKKVPEFIVDVDRDIPITKTERKSSYALIIGNEDYKSKQRGLTTEQNVEFAINDAEIFKLYCEKTLGIPNNQIKLIRNATAAEINQGLAWVNNLSKIENGDAKIIFYYSGHGLPDQQTKDPYLIPVDVSGSNIKYGIKLSNVYKSLTQYPANQISVFLDACFSGGARNQGLIAMKGIKVKPNKNIIIGNMVVFSSSSGNESSNVYREKQHGYFTYFLLKKLKETEGQIDYYNLGVYLSNSVEKETALRGIRQSPQVSFSQKVEEEWKSWKLK